MLRCPHPFKRNKRLVQFDIRVSVFNFYEESFRFIICLLMLSELWSFVQRDHRLIFSFRKLHLRSWSFSLTPAYCLKIIRHVTDLIIFSQGCSVKPFRSNLLPPQAGTLIKKSCVVFTGNISGSRGITTRYTGDSLICFVLRRKKGLPEQIIVDRKYYSKGPINYSLSCSRALEQAVSIISLRRCSILGFWSGRSAGEKARAEQVWGRRKGTIAILWQ